MPSSKLTIYTSNDPQGPGYLNGLSGSLINILDACLVNGYGTGSYYKAPAGWSKPLMNYSNSVAYGPQLACYKQASGSKCTLFVNDAGPNATSLYKEAWVCGFEEIHGLTSSLYPTSTVFTASAGNGDGNGQFPRPDQQLTYGHVVWRKSATQDSVGRQWTLIADASTMYLWVKTLDSGENYIWYVFGDMFALGGSNDPYRCIVMGRVGENTNGSIANSVDWSNVQGTGASTINGGSTYGPNWTGQPGHYIQRTAGGTGQSTPFCKIAGTQGNGLWAVNPPAVSLSGVYQCPNGPDNSFIFQPIQIIQSDVAMYRGRLRGIYIPQHVHTIFADGQVISGSGDYAGKVFTIIRPGLEGWANWAVETSATVETNS